MRCPQCGSDNPPEYRFCGMCGTTLAKKDTLVPESVSVRHETEREAHPPAPRIERIETKPRVEPVEPERRPEPVSSSLSGPSFLGLGSEPVHGNGTSDSDVSYLFDDEDARPRRTYWRFTVLLLLVIVIGGLVYLQYRKEGKSWTAPWSNGPAQTPAQASQPEQPQTQTAQPNASAQPNPPQNTPAGEATPPPASNATPPNNDASSTPQNNQAAPPQNPKASDQTGKSDQKSDTTDETETAKSEAPDANDTSADTEAPPAKPARPAKPKPTRATAPAASPDDALVANAEKYLYGRGVPQNCDRALSSLRSAAGRDNARARTLLGTMYATGHCVPKDLPNAYRWFAQASRTSPDNMWVQRNLEMIWREMTPQERQLATKSQ